MWKRLTFTKLLRPKNKCNILPPPWLVPTMQALLAAWLETKTVWTQLVLLSKGLLFVCKRVSAASATSHPATRHGASLTPHPSSSSHRSEKGAKSDEENLPSHIPGQHPPTCPGVQNQFTLLPDGTPRAINKPRVFTFTQTKSNRLDYICLIFPEGARFVFSGTCPLSSLDLSNNNKRKLSDIERSLYPRQRDR